MNEDSDLETIAQLLLGFARSYYSAEHSVGYNWNGEPVLGRIERRKVRKWEALEVTQLIFKDSKVFLRKCRSRRVASVLARKCIGGEGILPAELVDMVQDFIFYDEELADLVKKDSGTMPENSIADHADKSGSARRADLVRGELLEGTGRRMKGDLRRQECLLCIRMQSMAN